MGARNIVVAGDYIGRPIMAVGGVVQIFEDSKNYVLLDKFGVDSYDVVTEDVRKSAASGIARGAVGAALLGPVGLLAGLSAKNKGTYVVAVRFKDGKNSLIEIDQKIYQIFVRCMF